MRAAVVHTPGDAEAIEIIETAIPEPKAGEVRIKVEAAGVNPVDLQTRAGVYHELGWVTASPVGLGWDLAGTIDAVGDGVGEFVVGTPVAALSAGVDKSFGAYAEYAVVPVDAVAQRPDGITAVDAATVPLNALTAHQALARFGPAAGRRLLVTGAAGAVGGYALRLAADQGFEVGGLARESDRAFVESMGAALVIALPENAEWDAVFDAAALGDAVLAAVKDDGLYVGVVPPAVPDAIRGIDTSAVMVESSGETLATLLIDAAAGRLPARVHSVMPLEHARAAHGVAAEPGARGRVVLVL